MIFQGYSVENIYEDHFIDDKFTIFVRYHCRPIPLFTVSVLRNPLWSGKQNAIIFYAGNTSKMLSFSTIRPPMRHMFRVRYKEPRDFVHLGILLDN